MIASLSRGSLLDEVLHGGSNEQQLAAYVSWVNSQLKRKPGLKPITDLRRDLQDGAVLSQLIEIVAGEVLEGVYVAPQNKEESRKNVEQVLQFISSRHIRMSHISARDVVDGNLKSIMRIILALAAHFKPSANHRTATGSGRSLTRDCPSHNPLSTVALAQGAAAALASAQLDASKPARVTRMHRYSSYVVVETTWDDTLSETLEKEVQETRKMVSALQVSSYRELILILEALQDALLDFLFIRSRLDQSMEEAQELKRELLRCKQEMRNLQGVKDAQQQRLCTQEASILQMKQELLRASMTKDELSNQNFIVDNKPYLFSYLFSLFGWVQKEIGQKDRLLQQLKHKLEESQKQQAEEVQLLRDALRSLRNNFRDHDPQHHTLDTLEQGIVSLIDRLHVLHTNRGRGKSPKRKGQQTDSNSWPSTKACQSHSASSVSTKILYFTGKSPTPSMITIAKRLGEVTLKDVKVAVDREGNYRYHFKALDPEFGTVKEEVFLDGAIVPGWEGKIVAWLEEDRGEER
uniref:Dixin n=1 Tax=Mastacembelus armatus TaxID=205130 RepID=A0A3Q3MXR5_9TELE